jgi:hypothetical protein
VAIATLTTLDPLFKDMYLPRLRGQFYKSTPIYSRVMKRSEKHNFVGNQAIIDAHFQRSEAVGARAENAVVPTAQYEQQAQMTIAVAYNYGKIKLTNQTIQASRTDEGAFARALRVEMDGIKESLIFDLARQLVYGDGTGKIAQVNGSATSVSLVVDNPGTNHLRVGMVIDVYTSGGSQEVDSKSITAVSPSTNTVTIASSTFTDNSFVYREDARNVECMGLGGIIDDGTRVAVFQGVTRSTSPWLKANVLGNSGVNRTMTLRLIDDMCLEAEKNGGGGAPTAIYSRHVLAQIYADLVRADRRYTPKDMVLDGGFRAVEVTHPGGTAPWIMDRMARSNEIWAVNEEDLIYFEQLPISWMDMDGTVLHRALDGTDAYEALLQTYGQLAAQKCNGCTALQDISET